MARTPGSGWGGGTLLYQICPHCGKKKVIYDTCADIPPFKCTACKKRFHSNDLIRSKYPRK
jgi:predicted  nucleic acid-binding Zn ribbon protein